MQIRLDPKNAKYIRTCAKAEKRSLAKMANKILDIHRVMTGAK